jgi:hypothetical protein
MQIKKLLPPVLVVIISTLVLSPYLAGYVGITPNVGTNDLTDTHIPFRALMQRSMHSGHIPLWEPTISGGFPFFAEGQAGNLHPLNVLFTLMPLSPATSIALSLLAAYILSGLGMYYYIMNWLNHKNKDISKNTIIALFGGIVWTLCGFNINHIAALNVLNIIALIPWQLLCLDNLIDQDIQVEKKGEGYTKKIRIGLVLALTVVLQVVAGHPQFLAYSLIFITAYWFLSQIILPTNKLKTLLINSIIIIVACTLGLAMGAVQLLPTLEFTQNSTRQSGLSDENINFLSFRLKDISNLILPFSNFSPNPRSLARLVEVGWPFDERYVYMGIIPLLLALCAIPVVPKDRRALSIASLGLFFFLLSFGGQSPIGIVLKIPPFNLFRIPVKFMVFFQFAVAFLSVYTLNQIANRKNSQSKAEVKGSSNNTVIIVITVLLVITSLDTGLKLYTLYPLVKAEWWYSHPLTLQTYTKEITNNNHTSSIKYYTEKIIGQNYNEQIQKQYLEHDPKLWEERQRELFKNNRELLHANNMLYYDVPLLTNAINSLAIKIKWYSDIENVLFFERATPDTQDTTVSERYLKLSRLTGARYIIHDTTIKNDQLDLVKATNFTTGQDQIGFYKLKNPLQFIQIPKNIIFVKENDTFTALLKDSFNPATDMVLPSLEEKPVQTQDIHGDIKFLPINKTKIKILTNLSHEGYIFIRQSYYPGWQVKINNEDNTTPVIRANHAFQAIKLPSGPQSVILQYVPKSFFIGRYISIASTIIYCCVLLLSLKKKKPANPKEIPTTPTVPV